MLFFGLVFRAAEGCESPCLIGLHCRSILVTPLYSNMMLFEIVIMIYVGDRRRIEDIGMLKCCFYSSGVKVSILRIIVE